MWIKSRIFDIVYEGNTIKVKAKLSNRGVLQYLIWLPTGPIRIELVFDENEISYWVEIPQGRTQLAEKIGEIIEDLDNNPQSL